MTTDAPTPPTNVRAVLADGSTLSLECTYAGSRDGHEWVAKVPPGTTVAKVLMDTLPAHTRVRIAVDHGGKS